MTVTDISMTIFFLVFFQHQKLVHDDNKNVTLANTGREKQNNKVKEKIK